MNWKEEEEFCPECVIDGSHVVGLIDTNGNPHASPNHGGVSNKFTILNEQIIEPENKPTKWYDRGYCIDRLDPTKILSQHKDSASCENSGVCLDQADVITNETTKDTCENIPLNRWVSNEWVEQSRTLTSPPDTINSPDWNELINTSAVPSLGHEVMGVSPKNIFKGAEYQPADITAIRQSLDATGAYFGGSWSRHAGRFQIRVGSRPQLDDCAQGNSSTPVNLTYMLNMDNALCNHYMPVMDNKCGDNCWRGYGPYYEPNLSQEERGRALIRIDVTEPPQYGG